MWEAMKVMWHSYYVENKYRNNSWDVSSKSLNKKDGLTRYGDSHVKDKTSYRPSYL